MPVFRDGYVFELAGARIQVAQECSGIRSSVALVLSGLLASNLLLHSHWHRAVLLALIIPIAIIRNGARIWLIAWLCVEHGPHMIHSVYHKQGGPVFFALSLLPLIAVLWVFVRRERRAYSASHSSR
jgi:exosortase